MLLFHEEYDIMKLSDINRCCFRLIYDVLYIYLNMYFHYDLPGFFYASVNNNHTKNHPMGPIAHLGDCS